MFVVVHLCVCGRVFVIAFVVVCLWLCFGRCVCGLCLLLRVCGWVLVVVVVVCLW